MGEVYSTSYVYKTLENINSKLEILKILRALLFNNFKAKKNSHQNTSVKCKETTKQNQSLINDSVCYLNIFVNKGYSNIIDQNWNLFEEGETIKSCVIGLKINNQKCCQQTRAGLISLYLTIIEAKINLAIILIIYVLHCIVPQSNCHSDKFKYL